MKHQAYTLHIQAWCSTAVDENGVHRKGFWGYCEAGCPGLSITTTTTTTSRHTEDDVDVSECAASLTHQSDADTDTPK